MMRRLILAAALVAAPALSRVAAAQSVAEHLAAGDREYAALHPVDALAHYEAALKADSILKTHAMSRGDSARADTVGAEAAWKASRSSVDLGELEKNDDRKAKYFATGVDLARRAVALAPNDPETHFSLARALGRKALSVGVRERVKYAVEVRNEALKALTLDPTHAGALHVMGVWNAEVMRLNGVSRFIAKNVLGGKVFGEANWANARSYLERAVAVDPDRLTHHLDLGKIYLDTDDKAKAREQFEIVARGPAREVTDPQYMAEAEKLLREMK